MCRGNNKAICSPEELSGDGKDKDRKTQDYTEDKAKTKYYLAIEWKNNERPKSRFPNRVGIFKRKLEQLKWRSY